MNDLEIQFLKAYDTYSDPIFRHCYFRIHDRELAKELMQETFKKVWIYSSKGNEIRHMQAFLYQTATRLVIDYVRKKKDESLEAMQDNGFQPSIDETESIHISLESQKLIALIKTLDPSDAEVLLMRYMEELKPKEIAHILDEKTNVISIRLTRAKKKLKQLLKNQPFPNYETSTQTT